MRHPAYRADAIGASGGTPHEMRSPDGLDGCARSAHTTPLRVVAVAYRWLEPREAYSRADESDLGWPAL
jgi:hypothetical protein